jgi:hypothetical protein
MNNILFSQSGHRKEVNLEGSYHEQLNSLAQQLASDIKFPHKESYLAWVGEWKRQYRALSKLNRDRKLTRRLNPHNRPEKAKWLESQVLSADEYRRLWFEVSECRFGPDNPTLRQVMALQRGEYAHNEAFFMLALRKAAKLVAAQARAERLVNS